MAGYDPKKAAEYNRLIQQGLDPEAAIIQAGITYEEQGNYEINSVGTPATNVDYGKMSAISIGQGKVAGVDYDRAPADPPPTGSRITSSSYTETSTETVSGGGSTTITVGPRIPTAQSQAYATAGAAKQVEIDQFIKDNPSNFARRRQGLPLLTPEENEARNAQLNSLQDQRSQLYNQQLDSETPGAPTITSTPNTTTTTRTVVTQSSSSNTPVNFDQDEQLNQSTELQLEKTTTLANPTSARGSEVSPASDPSQFPAYDNDGNLELGFAINEETGQPYYAGVGPGTRDTPVSPASDPSQFPAYDNDGNLELGFAINEENGQPYYRGVEPPTQQTSGFDPYYDEFAGYDEAVARQVQASSAADINDPYYGLNPTQLQELGGADPTDPYIRARLGIPQLPGSTLFATGGFGTIKTGVPAIDSALGIIGKIPSLFSNFANTVGGLFGPKPTASAVAATTGSGVAGLTEPVTGPATTDAAVNPASDPSQFPAYDDDGNLQPGFAINEEDGRPYYAGVGPATQDTPVNPASDPSQFPAYDNDGNLEPGFAINDETGQPYYRGFPQPTANADVDLDADSGYGSDLAYTPVDTAALSVDATKVRASNPDLSPAAQQNLDNINQANANVVEAQGNIQSNNLNILRAEESIATARETQRQAEAIIAQNNAELADPFITDERRAELLANNAEQEASIAENAAFIEDQNQYIEEVQANTAEQQGNILENQLVAEDNAAAFRENDGGELLTVEPDLDPELQQPDEEVIVDTTDAADIDPETDLELQEPPDAEVEFAALAEPVDPDADPELLGGPEDEDFVVEADNAEDVDIAEDEALQEPPDAEVEFAALAEPVDPDADPELLGGPEEEVDPFAPLEEPPDVDAEESPELLGGPEEEVDPFAPLEEPPDVDAEESPELLGGPEDEEPDEPELLGGPEDVDTAEDEGLKTPDGAEEGGTAAETGLAEPTDADVEQANQEAAVRDRARQQATFQARYKQPGNADWRVRLSLAPNSQYLYNQKDAVGILAPLAKTDGVIFPYTPNITTTYSANYEQYDLVHSNYRGLFYKNSRVGDIQIRGTFTAQDTNEADYLLAVIHFFRSATKMFYGQDAERGVPPPVCLLNGFGQYQFSDHPVVISAFNYTLPNDVDYIRAGSPNNYGLNMLNRRAAVASNPGGTSLAGLNRLTNALLKKGAPGQGVPDPNAIQQNVSNTAGATYVPTKMEIDITLIPVQTRTQVSKQFSLKGFANGQLLKGGFW